MPDVSWHEQVSKRVQPLQIIVAALVAGCVTLLAVFLGVPQPQPTPAPTALIVTWIAVAMSSMAILMRLVVPAVITARGRKAILDGTFRDFLPSARAASDAEQWAEPPSDANCLIALYYHRTIVGAALLEGCAFLASLAYFVEHKSVALGVAILLILGVAAHFPTSARVIGWVERQIAWLEQERQFAC